MGLQAFEDQSDLGVVAAAGRFVGIKTGVHQQHRRGHVHGQGFGELERVLTEPAGYFIEGREEFGDFRLTEGPGQRVQGGDGVLKAR